MNCLQDIKHRIISPLSQIKMKLKLSEKHWISGPADVTLRLSLGRLSFFFLLSLNSVSALKQWQWQALEQEADCQESK